MPSEPTTTFVSLMRQLLRIELDGEGGAVYGTKEGYEALAASLLRAVEKPKRSASGQLIAEPDLMDILAADSDLPDFTLYVVDEVPPRPRQEHIHHGYGVGWLIAAMIAVIFTLAAIGVGAIINYLWLG